MDFGSQMVRRRLTEACFQWKLASRFTFRIRMLRSVEYFVYSVSFIYALAEVHFCRCRLITNMTTTQSGGAIFNRGSLVVSNSVFRNNLASMILFPIWLCSFGVVLYYSIIFVHLLFTTQTMTHRQRVLVVPFIRLPRVFLARPWFRCSFPQSVFRPTWLESLVELWRLGWPRCRLPIRDGTLTQPWRRNEHFYK